MKRKYACPDFSFPMVRHDQALKIIQTLEFEGVDIGLMKDRTHLQPADQLIAPEKSEMCIRDRPYSAPPGFIIGKDAAPCNEAV